MALPTAEVQRRWALTTPQWPIMNAVLEGVSRDQMMAQHQANHIQVAYAPSRDIGLKAMNVKAACSMPWGLKFTSAGSRHSMTGAVSLLPGGSELRIRRPCYH